MPVYEQALSPYQLEHVIGKGGFGTVYQAIGPDSKPVALKRCRLPKRQFSIDRHTDLRHESRILVYLRGHPSVPECIGYETDDRFEYLVMPLLGCALAHGPILDAATSLSLAQQMISALNHIHRKGLVRRDIKPGNILASLREPDRFFLIDYGLAQPLQSEKVPLPPQLELMRELMLSGSLGFTSVDTHDDLPASPRGDLESLAYTLAHVAGLGVPWTRVVLDWTATSKGKCRRVAKLKHTYIALAQAQHHRTVVELLLLHARRTPCRSIPDYEALLKLFASDTIPVRPVTALSSNHQGVQQPRSPGTHPVVFIGQIIAVQLLINVSINGRAIVDLEIEKDYLDPPHSQGKTLPALVLAVSHIPGCRNWNVEVLPLATTPGPPGRPGLDQERHFAFNPIRAHDKALCSGPPLYAVGYPTSQKFSIPVPEIIPPTLFAPQDAFNRLLHNAMTSRKTYSWHLYEGDEMVWERIFNSNALQPCARLLPLAGGLNIDWTSHRGWFDEIVCVQRQRAADEGKPWDGKHYASKIALTPDVLLAMEHRLPEGINVRELDALVPRIGSVSFSLSFPDNNDDDEDEDEDGDDDGEEELDRL